MTQPTPTEIDTFIDVLSRTRTEDDAYNEYAKTGDGANNALRRDNLRRYLQTMAERQPRTLLVMEAPGYRGCRLTGVPVTSRKVLLEGVPALHMFGEQAGYRRTDDAGFDHIYGEQSATIVWNTLADLQRVPLIWNTFPFHPHKAEKPLTNRRPRKAEMRDGARLLSYLLDLYGPKQVIAVGNVAHETLLDLGIACDKVRHPAQGGKRDFVAGLHRLLMH